MKSIKVRNREHLGKFQAKSDKGIFLDYSLNSRAYRIYNLHTKTIMESINVVVDDIAKISSEYEAVCFTDEVESQLQNTIVHLLLQQRKNQKIGRAHV